MRRSGKLTIASSSEALAEGSSRLTAELEPNGTMKLSLNGRLIANAKAEGTLNRLPLDGLQVGRDANGAVGDYTAPFAFGGKIERVIVEVGK